MGARLRLRQVVLAAPLHDLQAVVQVHPQGLFQAQQARLPVHQRQQDHAEGALHGGVPVQAAQGGLGIGVLAQLDDDAHPLPVRLVAQVRDAVQLLLAHQLGDALDEGGLVGHVRQLGDDDAAAAALHLLQVGASLHRHPPAARAVGPAQALGGGGLFDDDPAGGEVGPLDELHQVVQREVVQAVPVLQHVLEGVHHLPQVVWGDAGGHTDGDAGSAVHQQVGHGGRQNSGLLQGIVKVGGEIHRVFLNIGQHVLRELGQAGLGVAHGGRGVAVHAAEVALPVHQQVAHGEILGHARHGVVHRHVAVGVVLTQHFTDNTSGLLVRRAGAQAHVVHGIQDAPVHRLQAVAGVGQGPGHDHAHGVIQIGLLHLLININPLYHSYFHGSLQVPVRVCFVFRGKRERS